MIELRWLEKTHTPEHDGATGFVYKVLQYRLHMGERQNPDWSIEKVWSDWIDVPTVTEN